MGFKTTDLAPNAAYGPTATTPCPKDVVVKAFTITRSDLYDAVQGNIKCVIPADATILDIRVYGVVASDAGTSATLQIGRPGAPGPNGTYFGTADVKNGFGKVAVNVNHIMNVEDTSNGDIVFTGRYTEAGVASTVGGPWNVIVEYVR